MLKFLKFFLITTLSCLTLNSALADKLGLGRAATTQEIQAWDIDVRPDGQGLPEGKGSVSDGETIYGEKCASCHGEFGEGIDRWPVLAGGQDSLKSDDPVKTIGSYWPYLSTVYDYIYRAMPFGDAQSLTHDEVYAITAYILNLNDIVDEKFVLSKKNFTSIRMPNENNFIKDERPDTSRIQDKEPCMKDCKKQVKVIMRARILDVTPEDKN